MKRVNKVLKHLLVELGVTISSAERKFSHLIHLSKKVWKKRKNAQIHVKSGTMRKEF